jgi:hypothetical protein
MEVHTCARRWSAAAVCAVAVAGLSAGSAFGGEITGNGKLTPVKAGVAASVCSFSGLEDVAASPLRTQTPHEVWLGPEVGVVNPPPGTPGTDCRPGGGE